MDKKVFVFLDVDDTILDFHKAEKKALTRAFTAMGIDFDDEMLARYSVINKSRWELLELGEITREQVLRSRFEMLFAERGIEEDGERAQAMYEGFLSQGHFFIDGAEKLLETLYGRYELFIVSNGNASTQDGRLKSADISRYFRNIFISERVGYEKPQREFFGRCFETITDFDPTRAVIIGDSLTSDIKGGINAGIKTCWFNPRNDPGRSDIVPDYTVSSLDEIPKLLKRIFE